MSDIEIRELERKAATGDKEDKNNLMRARARIGEIQIYESEYDGTVYELRPWVGSRTDTYGNNRACDCPDLKRVVGMFCVCYGRAYCPTHGGPRCVGGHD